MSPTRCDRPARARYNGMQHAEKSGVPAVPAARLSPSCLQVPVLRPGGYFYFKFYRTAYPDRILILPAAVIRGFRPGVHGRVIQRRAGTRIYASSAPRGRWPGALRSKPAA
eukprot:SAG31_NODE_975_length_10623_cov_7.244964_10_plen_111_part_00